MNIRRKNIETYLYDVEGFNGPLHGILDVSPQFVSLPNIIGVIPVLFPDTPKTKDNNSWPCK